MPQIWTRLSHRRGELKVASALLSIMTMVGLVLHDGYLLAPNYGWVFVLLYVAAIVISTVQLALDAKGQYRLGPNGGYLSLFRVAWFEWLSLPLLLISILFGLHAGPLLWLRQAAVLLRLWSSSGTGTRINDLLVTPPALLLVISFGLGILFGTLFLSLPIATPGVQAGAPFLTAFFTATSAICVTGLIVVDTATYWSTFGQIVILGLIQLGGLGIMTFSTGVAIIAGQRLAFKRAEVLEQVLEETSMLRLEKLIPAIIRQTFALEAIGATVLFLYWLPLNAPPQVAFLAVFHAVSAFCNAGFSLFTDNLMGWVSDGVVNTTIALLIILGGLGFPVMFVLLDPKPAQERIVFTFFKGSAIRRMGYFLLGMILSVVLTLWLMAAPWTRLLAVSFGRDWALIFLFMTVAVGLIVWVTFYFVALLYTLLKGHGLHLRVVGRRLGVHGRLALLISGILLGVGFLLVYWIEWANALRDLGLAAKFLASFFTSVTARTAGFNTLDMASLEPSSLFLILVLMYVGASPGGTGGGIKTTTLGVLFLSIRAMVTRRPQVEIWSRSIPLSIFYKAVAILVVSLAILVVFLFLLLISQPHLTFPLLLFEAVSAFGTVGLSLGITSSLDALGQILIVTLMFMGRLGPLTLALAVGERAIRVGYQYPEGRVMVG